MRIASNTVVSLDVAISDAWGNLLERSEQPLSYLHGSHAGIMPALEQALAGKQAGETLALRLEPEDAFGDYDEALVRVEVRERFPETLEVGMQFEGLPDVDGAGDGDDAQVHRHGPECTHEHEHDRDHDHDHAPVIYAVTDIADGMVVLDGNHPYAGIALQFDCTVRAVRAASASEIERGWPDDSTEIVRLAER